MIKPNFDIEQKLWAAGQKYVCGLDEVGRGCFAGSVVVGAVIFPQDVKIPDGLADSKMVPPKKRTKLAEEIKKLAVVWEIGEVGVDFINTNGIAQATQEAFRRALQKMAKKVKIDYCLIDAFYISGIDQRYQRPVQDGDKICASISAASIIAKVYRDGLMVQLHEKYPQYGFNQHKGYGTLKHREAIKKYGLCPLHRTSFNLEKFL